MNAGADDFLMALAPVVERLGASIVAADEAAAGDTPIEWHGSTVAWLRVTELHGALDRCVATVERELATPLADMDRGQKQAAVRRLNDQGAFLLRGAVEDLAARMGVSKVTLYSYLNAISD